MSTAIAIVALVVAALGYRLSLSGQGAAAAIRLHQLIGEVHLTFVECELLARQNQTDIRALNAARSLAGNPIDPKIVSRVEDLLKDTVKLREGAEEVTKTATHIVTAVPQHMIVTLEGHLAGAREIRLRLKSYSEEIASIRAYTPPT